MTDNNLKPKVTVLLTVYNGMPYVCQSIQSILEQTYTNFEFIIANDGSSDNTFEYLSSLQDSRIKILNWSPNKGRTVALNIALESVTTDYVAIIDADDISLPNRLFVQMNYLNKNPELDLLGSGVRYINEKDEPLGVDFYPEEHNILLNRMPLVNQFAHSACIFKTSTARKVGGYPKDFLYAQDCGLWLAIMKEGGRVASIPAILTQIRVHQAQSTKLPSLLTTRRNDNLLFAKGLLEIKELSKTSKQAAFLRGAGALWQLGQKKESLKWILKSFTSSPLSFFTNKLVWERFIKSKSRKRKHELV